MRVLLVDDSRTMRNIIRKTLIDGMGVPAEQVEEAGDGREALQHIEGNAFDLYMVDWNMPNMDGITLLRKLRASGDATPFMMCTTEAEKRKVVEAIKAGASGYMVKPFSPDVIKEKVTQTLAKCATPSR